MTVYLLSAFAALAAVYAVGWALHIKAADKIYLVFKIIATAFAAVYIVRYCIGRDNIFGIYALTVSRGFSSRAQIAFGLVEVWTMFAAELAVIMYPFFAKSVKSFEPIAAWSAVVFLVCLCGLRVHVLAVDGQAALNSVTLRGVLLSIETGLGLGMSGLLLTKRVVAFVIKRKVNLLVAPADSGNGIELAADSISCPSEVTLEQTVASVGKKRHDLSWVWYVLAVLGIIVATMPFYAPQLILDPNAYAMKVINRNYYHRLYIYPAAVIPIVLYLLLKDKPLETRRLVLLYYALAALNGFVLTHKLVDYQGANWVTALPLHLCNTALYVTPLCLTFRLKRVFYFTYFINVLGAAVALTMPNYSTDGLNGSFIVAGTISFFFSHHQAFFMPLLIVGLGIFKRPGIREFRYSLIGFAVYYLLMLICNGWFTNYNAEVDYFFINSDFIVDKLGNWAKVTRNLVWEFDIGSLHFKYYPVFQSLFFVVYIAISLGMWFLYELGFNVAAGWKDVWRRNKKTKVDRLALEVKLAGRSIEQPMDTENTNALILNNFTKRYGKSDVYAVKDACLAVHGGEIFGFLGPNGAGKSTIINSIVGIQTITGGSITVCGYDVKTQSVQAKRQIGFVPDHYALYEQLTAREYINYIADLYEVSQSDRDERLARFIKLFEFETAIDNPIKTYSHGMKQKVTIMSALIHDPKVWILDEPLTGLDPNSIFQVKECMKQHAAAGNIVFFSSHIIDVVERICNRIAIIRKGQIQCVKNVEEIEANGGSLEQFYMGVINGADVQPIAVGDRGDDGDDDTGNKVGAKKRRLADIFKKRKGENKQ